MKRSVIYLTTLALSALLVCAPRAHAKSDCDNVKGTGNTFATGPATFQGTATFKIGGQTQNASVTTNLLGPPEVGDDGTLHARTSHSFVLEDGSSITTVDNAVLSPTSTPGLYRLNTRAAITEGTGAYEDACGRLSIHGTINLVTGEVAWRFTGRICDCG